MKITNANGYDGDAMVNYMHDLCRIIAGLAVNWPSPNRYAGRPWYRTLMIKHKEMHPAVFEAARYYRPRNWHLLVLEFPYRATTDPNRLAYTRDERAGEQDKQTVTTIGKYLTRHFDMPDHVIRDIVARHTTDDTFKFVHTIDEMVYAVNNGPASCMNWCDRSHNRHPYEVYDPKYGWHMALRHDKDGRIVGRALCTHSVDDEDAKYWVRSFKRGDGYSYADEFLEAWLKGHGYEKRGSYELGQQMARLTNDRGSLLAPYIDGDERFIVVERDCLRLVESDDSEYSCENTDGTAEERNLTECEDCGERISDGDHTFVGPYEDRCVCERCLSHDYNYAYTRHGNQSYIDSNNVVWVGDDYYDLDFLEDNDIVELHDGEYVHTDDAVYVSSCDEYYAPDDDKVVCDYNGEWQLRDDCVPLANGELALDIECWCCEASGDWYLNDDVEPVIVDGATYHPDNAPETNLETKETNHE